MGNRQSGKDGTKKQGNQDRQEGKERRRITATATNVK